MGLRALTDTLVGEERIPSSPEDWQDWVSATATRGYAMDDPLVDWLERHGESKGFQRDTDLPGYDPRTDFTEFLFKKGNQFEQAVLAHLRTLAEVTTIANGPGGSRDLAMAKETFAAMQAGVPIIYQGVLRDAETRTYGALDLLVRSDELERLFPGAVPGDEAAIAALELGDVAWHYRVVDIKFTTLTLRAGGDLGDGGSSWAYKQQVFIYNRALGRLQGYEPPRAYLMGRGWEQRKQGQTRRVSSCMDRLAPLPQDYVAKSKGSLADAVESSCAWVRRMRKEGATWTALPEPTVEELRPNMSSTADYPWHAAKQRIGHALEDLTLLWQVGLEKRRLANQAGIYRWTDLACTALAVGVTGDRQAPTLDAILDVNRSDDGQRVRPPTIAAGDGSWRSPAKLEFYVDFETVSDLDDDFTRIPKKSGQPLIFMIGCGHVEDGQWRFRCFTADALVEKEETAIIDAWLAHMEDIGRRVAPKSDDALSFHWSQAEVVTLDSAYNSATRRHGERSWRTPRWFDFLKQVIREEPVVVRGAMSFGLKAVASAMHGHGLLETKWEEGPTDGLGAMVGAWWCAEEALRHGVALGDIPLMREIAQYNEVDCRVMMEIVRYLRAHH